MKKILLTLLSIFMLVPIIGTFDSKEVKALGQSEMACSAFEVDYINDDGSFLSQGCYDDLASAKAKMKENNDYVVRHSKSLSYTKIVAMNSGIAYSYPRWGATLNIYQNLYNQSIYYKSTYVSRHYELDYVDTPLTGVGSKGYMYGMIEVNVMGFHGYCDLENTDLVPSKFINNGITITLGGNNSYTSEEFFSIVPKQNYFEVNSSNELVFHMYYGYGTNNTAESYSFTIGKASDQMSVGSKYYSYDGYTFYTSSNFSGNSITYYNYYQFLPLRSKSTVTADMLNSYISSHSGSAMINHGQDFIDAQNKYGINALILYSMAIHESGYGLSGYAKNRNNLFGWNAYDGDPNQASYFSSVSACVNEQAGINLRGYVDITDGRFFSSSLGNKGSGLNVKYASDPYWGMKIASYAYAIDKNYNNSKDLNAYTLSVINQFDIDVKSSASDSSSTLYTTQYGPYYQENFIVINLGDQGNGYTKIQSTNPIDDNGNIKTHRTPITTGNLNPISYGEYNYDKSVAYVKTSYLTALNSSNNNTVVVPEEPNTPVVVEKKARSIVDSLSLSEEGILNITGCAYIQGLSFASSDNITFTINIKNVSDDSVYKSYYANVTKYEGLNFNDGLDYSYTGFNASIPTKEIINDKDFTGGIYYLSIEIKNGDTILSSTLTSSNKEYSNLNYSYGGFSYHISTNSRNIRRIEIDIESLPSAINYSEINKPSRSKSFFNYDTLTIDESGNFKIDGQAAIYYTNFDNKDNVTYTLYIIDDSNNYFTINCTTKKSETLDFKKLLKTSYNMDYICFEGSANLVDLNNNTALTPGTYSMILKVVNGEFVDYVELNTLADLDVSNDNYRIFKSNVRNRIMLQVKGDKVLDDVD